jgi:hypothetical protein
VGLTVGIGRSALTLGLSAIVCGALSGAVASGVSAALEGKGIKGTLLSALEGGVFGAAGGILGAGGSGLFGRFAGTMEETGSIGQSWRSGMTGAIEGVKEAVFNNRLIATGEGMSEVYAFNKAMLTSAKGLKCYTRFITDKGAALRAFGSGVVGALLPAGFGDVLPPHWANGLGLFATGF